MLELSTLLLYQNNAVIDYFHYHHPDYTVQDVQVLFTDLLAWMWLNAQRAKQGKKTYLFGPLLSLDEIWHTFILHTRDYVDFSNQYFSCYFHHDVEPIGFEHMLREEELTDYLEECFTYLGSDWVTRRFAIAFSESSCE